MEKLHYLSLFLANMQILRLRKLESDLYSIDEKSEYIFLDKPMRIEVLATYSNKPKPIAGLLKELVKWILH